MSVSVINVNIGQFLLRVNLVLFFSDLRNLTVKILRYFIDCYGFFQSHSSVRYTLIVFCFDKSMDYSVICLLNIFHLQLYKNTTSSSLICTLESNL